MFKVLTLLCIGGVLGELLGLVEVSRHGARSVLIEFPWDTGNWPQGLGELTEVGMRQHFLLGAEYRHRYIATQHFLSSEYSPAELTVRSTNANRTIMSAQSQLLGLYPESALLTEEQAAVTVPFEVEDATSFQTSLGLTPISGRYQPIPIHVVERNRDYMLNAYSPDTCPKMLEYLQEQQSSEAYQTREEEYSSPGGLQEQLRSYFNANISFDASAYMADALTCIITEGFPTPLGLPEDLLRQMRMNKDFIISEYLAGEGGRLASSLFLQELLEFFSAVLSGETTLKFKYFSAHDLTLNAFRQALQFYDRFSPPFATTLLFELHSDQTVRTIYNDQVIQLQACESEYCAFSQFTAFLESLIVPDVVFACHNVTASEYQTLSSLKVFPKLKNS